MGSDFAMEARNFTPRPSYAAWDGDDLVIYKDYPISGWVESWRGTNPNLGDKTVLSLIHTMVAHIPAKPVSIERSIEAYIRSWAVHRISMEDAVESIKELFNERTIS